MLTAPGGCWSESQLLALNLVALGGRGFGQLLSECLKKTDLKAAAEDAFKSLGFGFFYSVLAVEN